VIFKNNGQKRARYVRFFVCFKHVGCVVASHMSRVRQRDDYRQLCWACGAAQGSYGSGDTYQSLQSELVPLLEEARRPKMSEDQQRLNARIDEIRNAQIRLLEAEAKKPYASVVDRSLIASKIADIKKAIQLASRGDRVVEALNDIEDRIAVVLEQRRIVEDKLAAGYTTKVASEYQRLKRQLESLRAERDVLRDAES